MLRQQHRYGRLLPRKHGYGVRLPNRWHPLSVQQLHDQQPARTLQHGVEQRVAVPVTVEVQSADDVVFIRIDSPIEARDGVMWAEELTRVANASGGRVHIVAELVPAVSIPLGVFLAACRKALDLAPIIRSLAFVARGPAERTPTRVAATVIAPAYAVEYFDDVDRARAWITGRQAARAS